MPGSSRADSPCVELSVCNSARRRLLRNQSRLAGSATAFGQQPRVLSAVADVARKGPSNAMRLGWLVPSAAAMAAVLIVAGCTAARQSSRVVVTPPRPASAPATLIPAPAPPPPASAPVTAVAALAGDTLNIRVRITDDQGTRIVSLPIEEYVAGAVRAELSPTTVQSDAVGRILEVQAVVSRTYAVANLGRHRAEGFDLCDGTHCQLYRRPLRTEHDDDAVARAVAHTHGQLITFEGRPIQAVFHSSCGGSTAAAEDVWNGAAVSYLRPVPDWFCLHGHEAHWEFTTDEQQIRRALNADARTAMGGRLDRIDIVSRDAAGRAALIAVAGARTPMVRAEEFRAIMLRAFGPRSIQSTWFTVTRRGNQFQFTGVGSGHGVGLCQTGAALRARAGQTPAESLAHYFPGTHVELASAVASVLSRHILTPTAQ